MTENKEMNLRTINYKNKRIYFKLKQAYRLNFINYFLIYVKN